MCYQGDVVGGFTIQSDGALLLFMAMGMIKSWRRGKLETLVEEIPEERDSRFNDVIADPCGRVFCGTMASASRSGRLYRLDLDGRLTVMLEDVRTNGIAFSLNRTKMYYTDTNARCIYMFRYDERTGGLADRRIFTQVQEDDGLPDGLTVDGEGYLWSARWDGGCVVRYAPDGTEDCRIIIPTQKVTSLTFGGEDYTDVYVTTAGGNNRSQEGPGAGALYRFRSAVRGIPEFFSQIAISRYQTSNGEPP